MVGWLALACGLGTAGACAGRSGPGYPLSPAPTGTPAPAVLDSPRGYLWLADGTVHLASEGEPAGLFVAGSIEGGRFVPEGDVLGLGPLGATGTSGWLELLDGNFYTDGCGHEPLRPFVVGTMQTDGTFSPTSRQVIY